MRFILTFALFALAACSHSAIKNETPSAPAVYTKASEMPVEEFFRNPQLSSYRISSDGQTLAFLKPWKNRMNIFVHPVGQPENVKQVTFVEDRDIPDVFWKGSDFVLYHKDQGGNENYHVYAANIKSGKTTDLTPYKDVRATVFDLLETISPTDILVQHNDRNKEVYDLYRVNLATNEIRMIAENKNQITSWLVDHAGNPRGGVATDGVNSVFYFEKVKGQPWEPVFKTDFRTNFEPLTFTADNKNVYAITNFKRDLNALVEVDPRQPQAKFIKRVIYAHPRYDVEGATYSERRRKMGSVSLVTDRRETFFLHPEDKAAWAALKNQFPKETLVPVSSTLDEKTWIVQAYSDISRGSFHLADHNQKSLVKLGDVAPWLNPDLMSETTTVEYRARDGLKIQGYLTVPRGMAGRDLPVIVNPHGGPWARDEWRFSPQTQFLASRGYAVFQPNFRGSTGYGRKFWESSFKQWGKKMQDDVSDGVLWMQKRGIANKDRVCIYGGSYGGYTTLAGITFTPELYACAVDYVGVSNLFTFLKTLPPYWKPYLAMLYAMVGDPEKDKDLLRAASPVFHVDKIRAPLFVAQGANDPRVVKAESDQIVEALRKRGVTVEYMVKENEGHGFRNEENRFDFYRAMEKFLRQHLGGRA